jgi:hypothetical protein
MNSLTDLREVVDVVIGVDTHVHTHCAAVVDAATGGVLKRDHRRGDSPGLWRAGGVRQHPPDVERQEARANDPALSRQP